MERLNQEHIDNISGMLHSGFEQELFKAALDNLNNNNALRFNNFAYAMRELLRNLLHRLSPDEKIKICKWYIAPTDSANDITRIQRMKYAIQGGLSDNYVVNNLKIDNIDEVIKNLNKIINNTLNKYTHIESHTFNINNETINKLVNDCILATHQVIEAIYKLKDEVINKLVVNIDQGLVDKVIGESIDEITVLASSQSIEDIYSTEIDISEIGPNYILLEVEGEVDCDIQWGSNSDVRKGDGSVGSMIFPLTAIFKYHFDETLSDDLELVEFNVDTSSWYEENPEY